MLNDRCRRADKYTRRLVLDAGVIDISRLYLEQIGPSILSSARVRIAVTADSHSIRKCCVCLAAAGRGECTIHCCCCCWCSSYDCSDEYRQTPKGSLHCSHVVALLSPGVLTDSGTWEVAWVINRHGALQSPPTSCLFSNAFIVVRLSRK
jgi:hypothetical protein